MSQRSTRGPGGPDSRLRSWSRSGGRYQPSVSGAPEVLSTPPDFRLTAAEQHEHACCLYREKKDWFDVVRRFLETGMTRREKCVCVVSSGSRNLFLEVMHAAAPLTGTNAIELTTIDRAYFRSRTPLLRRTLEYWSACRRRAAADGFTGLRGIIQADRLPGGSRALASWIAYEYQIGELLRKSGGAMLCLYNREARPAEFAEHMLSAHPSVVNEGAIGENTFYLPASENRVSSRSDSTVDRRLASLARHWKWQSDSRVATRGLPYYARRRLSQVLHSLKISAVALRDLESKMRLLSRAQEELRRQMKHFALGQKLSRTGSWTWNPSSGELFWSREHFRIFGLDAENNKPRIERSFG
jgi:hypothetical protein